MNTAALHSQVSGLSQEMAYCHHCQVVSKVVRKTKGYGMNCPRCRSAIHLRKVNSINRTWVLVLLGFLVFIPSHLFPVMIITQLGEGTYNKTILDGVVVMLDADLWGLALVVFVASVMVPLVKLVGLAWLLLAVRYRWLGSRFRLTQMYRVIVFIGRWAMVDIFFASIFISVLQIDSLISIEAGYGATFFASMCIITMVAAEVFDPRFLWDHYEEKK